ncbi:MAG: GTPase [Nanoarchaeota archaeon]|nr:GTPase [Nanoarchaeota archaeon]
MRKQREKYPALLKKVVTGSDIILEVIDARFIVESRNERVEEWVKGLGKRLIYVFNKADLVDMKKINKSVLKNLRPYVFVSATERHGGKDLREKIKIEAKKVRVLTGEKFDKINVGVIGQPNSGKSSIINLLIGRSSAGVGSQAGFTKGIQKLRLSEDVLLFDSPGVIPENKYSPDKMESISLDAMIGARSPNKLKDPEMVIAHLFSLHPKVLKKFYGVGNEIIDSEEFIEAVGRKMNFLKKGGVVDEDKISRKIIHDWQDGKIKV